MFKGTTPTLYFKIKNIDDLSTVNDIWITFRTKEQMIINKSFVNKEIKLNFEDKIASVDLTQEETLTFPEPCVNTQMKVLFNDDKVCVSPIFTIPIETPLNTKTMKSKTKDDEDSSDNGDDNGEE